MHPQQDDIEAQEDRNYSEDAYYAALMRLEPPISGVHRRMLVAHAEAPECKLSVHQIASAGGYDHPNATYSQYGHLADRIARALGETEQRWVKTRTIATDSRTPNKELIWQMHAGLANALVRLGWASRAGAPNVFEDNAQAFDLDTERDALVRARIGQSPFRFALLRYWGNSCAVTGITESAVLRASHIKPWRDASDEERLDPNNGLLLAAHMDALFDSGLITFEAKGQIRLSSLLTEETKQKLNITITMRLRRVTKDHETYLVHHRTRVFRAGSTP